MLTFLVSVFHVRLCSDMLIQPFPFGYSFLVLGIKMGLIRGVFLLLSAGSSNKIVSTYI